MLGPIHYRSAVPPTVKINKNGEVMWAKALDQQQSDYSGTGIISLAYDNGVLYAVGKRKLFKRVGETRLFHGISPHANLLMNPLLNLLGRRIHE